MARPKKKTPRRNKMIALRLTPEERFRLMERAWKACMTVSEYLRVAAIGGRRRTAKVQRIIAAPVWPADVYHEARRIGVNLNQIARRLNTFPERGVPEALNTALAELLDLLATVRARYGPPR